MTLAPPPSPTGREGDSVLDRNLRALLTRAYQPAVPSDLFRERVRRVLRQEFESSAALGAQRADAAVRRKTSVPARRVVSRRAFLSVAAILVACIGLTGYLALRTDTSTYGPRVEVAGRAARSFTDRERSKGFEIPAGRLRLLTDGTLGASAQWGSMARLDLATATTLTLAADSGQGQLTLELERGALLLDRYSSGAAWDISSPAGVLSLERGLLELTLRGEGPARELLARLVHGRASARTDTGVTPLESGGSLLLRDGRVIVASTTAAPPISALASRTALGSLQAPEASTTTANPSAPNTFSIEGELRWPTGARLERFVVTRLRHERLPRVSFPARARFEDAPRFRIEDLSAGTYDVFVEAEGFGVARALDVVLDASHGHAKLRFELQAEIPLEGLVVDASTQLPIDGAWVLAEDDLPVQMLPFTVDSAEDLGRAAARTRADGTFRLLGLSAGTHVLRVSAPRHGALWSQATVSDAAHVPARVELALGPGGAVEGHSYRLDGSADAGSYVIASRIDLEGRRTRMSFGQAITDAQGAYAIEDLPTGPYVLLHFSMGSAASVPVDPIQVRIEAGQRLKYDLGPKRGAANLRGRVVDARGAPLEDLDITLEPSGAHDSFSTWRSTRVQPGGAYGFLGIAPGRYDVFVGENLGSSFAFTTSVDVPSVGDHVQDLVAPDGTISGTVMRGPIDANATAGPPVRQCWMILNVVRDGREEFAGRTVTDAEGHYRLRWLPAGTYTLVAAPAQDQLAPARRENIVLGAGIEQARVDFTVVPGADLTVHVVDAEGRAQPRAVIELRDAAGQVVQYTAESVTDARGDFRVPGLAAGSWTVSASSAALLSGARSIDLVAGESRVLELRLAPR